VGKFLRKILLEDEKLKMKLESANCVVNLILIVLMTLMFKRTIFLCLSFGFKNFHEMLISCAEKKQTGNDFS